MVAAETRAFGDGRPPPRPFSSSSSSSSSSTDSICCDPTNPTIVVMVYSGRVSK